MSSRQRSMATSGRSDSIEEVDESSFPARRSRSANRRQAVKADSEPEVRQPSVSIEVASGPDSDDRSPFATVLAAFEEEANGMLQSPRGVKVSGMLNRFFYKYKFPNFRNGTTGCHKIPVEEVLHYNASAILDSIDKRKYEGTELYPWLKKLAKTDFRPVALKASEFPYRMTLREQRSYHARRPDSGIQAAPDAALSGDGSDVPPPRIGKRPGRPKGSKSSLRPIKSAKTRSHPDMSSDVESDNPASAAAPAKYTDTDVDEIMADFANDDSADESSSSRSETSHDQPKLDQQDFVKIAIRADKIPSTTPQGHRGTWCCEQEGCDHVVRGGDDDEMQAKIQEHFQHHEENMDRMQLALTESRGLLPIRYVIITTHRLPIRSCNHSTNMIM